LASALGTQVAAAVAPTANMKRRRCWSVFGIAILVCYGNGNMLDEGMDAVLSECDSGCVVKNPLKD
jgi:hypothetical protein